jgi:hypothetical protein
MSRALTCGAPPALGSLATLAALAALGALAAAGAARADERPWAERLGYPLDRPVVILHADDLGMCFEANQAATAAFEGGRLRSGSAMVPCPWFDDLWAWYAAHPELDLGLHLTLTSEWRTYRWGPVAPRAEVPALCDKRGYLWPSALEVAFRASPAEVEREVRAQIDRALALGVRPGHMDTHMGTLYARRDYAEVLLRLAVEYEIPALAIEPTPAVVAHFRAQGYPLDDEAVRLLAAYPLPKLDALLSAPAGRSYADTRANLIEMVRALPRPGLTEIIIHPARESDALRRITNAWQQRVWEAALLDDPDFQRELAEICTLTDWKEVMRRFEASRR